MPDDGLTVLVHAPKDDEPVWLGYWDSEDSAWRGVDGERYETKVTHWANLPEPPKTKA